MVRQPSTAPHTMCGAVWFHCFFLVFFYQDYFFQDYLSELFIRIIFAFIFIRIIVFIHLIFTFLLLVAFCIIGCPSAQGWALYLLGWRLHNEIAIACWGATCFSPPAMPSIEQGVNQSGSLRGYAAKPARSQSTGMCVKRF
jgi:hypothetical protein